MTEQEQSDTRGEVTELPPLDVTNREYYEWRSQCRRELACRERQLLSALSSNLLLREENERLKGEVKAGASLVAKMTDKVNDREIELATLRASSSSVRVAVLERALQNSVPDSMSDPIMATRWFEIVTEIAAKELEVRGE